MQSVPVFDKYEQHDAYHWDLTDARWRNGKYNPPTVARFGVMDDLLPEATGRVLDIGCGDGYLLNRVGNSCPNAELFGVDYEKHAVKLAGEYLSNYGHCPNVSEGSAYELPFEESFFDTVLMTEVIEHLHDPGLALSETKRVLRKGGKFLITTPNQQPSIKWDPDYHVHEFSHGELQKMLNAHFAETQMIACCPMSWMRHWRSRPINRSIIRSISRLGFNPMLRFTKQPTQKYGQLIAKCIHK